MLFVIAICLVVLCALTIFIAATFHEIAQTLTQMQFALEDMIKADMEHAEPELRGVGRNVRTQSVWKQ